MLAVGDSTDLEIIFKTGKYKTRVSKRPRIETNEGTQNKFVSISSYVVERPDSTFPIVIEPYKIDLSQFSEKVIDRRKFTIVNVSDQNLELSVVSMPDGLFEIRLPESVGPGKKVNGRLQLREDAYDESFEKSVTIEVKNADDESTTRFTIPVKRSIKLSKTTPPDMRTTPGEGSG